MTVGVEKELLIHNLVRLRRAHIRQPDIPELPQVRSDLESLVGGSVPRALAARVLGVSQTALDKRIARGDVPVVITSVGRREVPLALLVGLISVQGWMVASSRPDRFTTLHVPRSPVRSAPQRRSK